MQISLAFVTALMAAAVNAQCPSVWGTVASDLRDLFDGCNAQARAAIRLPFHDCWPGACDGSILLSDECTTRGENTQLVNICSALGNKTTEYNVGAADMIQVAAAIAIELCPPSPTLTVRVGRNDSSTANAENQIPGAGDSADSIIANFAAKGFDSDELVALIGAHSAGTNLSGTGLDSTETSLDSTTYYSEVLDGTAPAILQSDANLAASNVTKAEWEEYAEDQDSWNDEFKAAMEKMAIMGVDDSSLVDCTSTIFG